MAKRTPRRSSRSGPPVESDEQRLERLERAGILRRGRGNIRQFLKEYPPLKLNVDLSGALDEEREDRF